MYRVTAVGIASITPLFHSIPNLAAPLYAIILLLILGGTALAANKWELLDEKLPV